MSKELPAEVIALSAELGKKITGHTEGVAAVEVTNKTLPLPDGITLESLQQHQDFMQTYVAAATDATAEFSQKVFKENGDISRVSAAFPIGRDRVAVQIDKEAEINIPGKGKELRENYITTKYRTRAVKSAGLKAVKDKWCKKK